jgi:hypothetical protein
VAVSVGTLGCFEANSSPIGLLGAQFSNQSTRSHRCNGYVTPSGNNSGKLEVYGSSPGVVRSRELTQENSSVLTYLLLLLVAVLAVVVVVLVNRRTRLQRFRDFAATVGHTLQLETCGGIKATNLHEYLCAIASALRTQAMLRNLELRPGEFKQAVTDAVESAHLLKRDGSNKEGARATLLLFASCLDATMSRTLAGEATEGDEENLVGTVGAVALLASVGWHPESNADLVTCALSETSPARDMAEFWRSSNQAHRDQVESAFERVVRTALDPATAAYVRHKVFSDLKGDVRSAV